MSNLGRTIGLGIAVLAIYAIVNYSFNDREMANQNATIFAISGAVFAAAIGAWYFFSRRKPEDG